MLKFFPRDLDSLRIKARAESYSLVAYVAAIQAAPGLYAAHLNLARLDEAAGQLWLGKPGYRLQRFRLLRLCLHRRRRGQLHRADLHRRCHAGCRRALVGHYQGGSSAGAKPIASKPLLQLLADRRT